MVTELVETQTDAGAVSQTPDITGPDDHGELDEALALLEEVEGKPAAQDAEGTQTRPEGSEPTADEEELKALETVKQTAAEKAAAEAVEKERSEAAERQRQETANRQFDGVRQSFGLRANAIREFLAEKGVEDADINRVVATFNEHHAQSGAVVGAQFLDAVNDFAKANLPDDAAKAFIDAHKPATFKSWGAVFDDLKSELTKAARTGHVPESQIKQAKAEGFLQAKRHYQKNPHLLTSQTQTAVGRSQGMTGGRSDDEILLDPNSPIDQVNRILDRRSGQ